MKIELKDSIIKKLEKADERLLKMIKALIECYQEEETGDYDLNDAHNKEIDRRRERYLEDPEDSYTWDEVKESIRNASKNEL